MKTMIKTLSLALLLGTVIVSGALADMGEDDKPAFSITPYLGLATWHSDIGVEDGLIFGGRGAFHILQWLSVEGTYGYNGSKRDFDGTDVGMSHLGADLVAELYPTRKFNPYLAGGWSQLNYRPDVGEDQDLNGWEAAIGAKIRLGGDNASYRALRIDIRDVFSNLSEAFPNYGDSKHSLVTTVGVQFAFGKSSKDSDNDGIRDNDDLCADTPAGAMIDETGCPVDSDGDGVFDGLDQCEDTPAGAVVDASGCPIDSDGDGVYDGLDQCADTPAGATVDANGCPSDSDGDGVYDGIDQCPDTPAELQVDQAGCPIAVTEMEVQLLDTGRISTNSIVFGSSSADLDLAHNEALNEVGDALSHWPELRVEIGGYTDSSGSEAFNQQLSEKRAQSVLDYLVANYPNIKAEQYTAVGYGEADPIADNGTVEGRAENRRVEFKVLNTDDLQRQIEKRRMLER